MLSFESIEVIIIIACITYSLTFSALEAKRKPTSGKAFAVSVVYNVVRALLFLTVITLIFNAIAVLIIAY
ncbi:hypothetical protein [Vibrio barjaei]|uniref:hypothetical protein n=1 Tax=Vibrio barjaei TaxID=1676683 RepID=UPI0022852562|nr:hypothetical protein [Vibrio barjaei]MCY9874506.1 hypothetical protein [Vibrio barjaei]